MGTTQAPTAAPPVYMQGLAVPAEAVNPREFFRRTRKHIQQEASRSWNGVDPNMTFELRKSDILGGLTLRIIGSVVVTPGTGTVATTARWPYDLLQAVRFTANGASNLINVSGAKLKARSLMARGDLNDRGVSQSIGNTARTQGTMSLSQESWGLGSQATAVGGGTYNFDLTWYIPVAEDDVDLSGAIFLATSTADLTLSVDFAPIANLFALTGNATAAFGASTTVQVHSTKYSIPNVDGGIIVPDLSVFHSLIQSRTANGLQLGENEVRLVGQGAGKSLLRLYYQVWNGTPSAPLAMTAANFGPQSYRYATNETPETYIDGSFMRADMERRYSSDLGAYWGFGCFDYAWENAFRDVLDLGTAGEFRAVVSIANSVALTNPAIEYVTESIFAAGQAA